MKKGNNLDEKRTKDDNKDPLKSPVYVMRLGENKQESKNTKGILKFPTSSHKVILRRPCNFEPNSTQDTYKCYPQLACCQPSYPKLQFPQPWGLPVNPTKKLGHPTCPPAPNLEKLKVMNHAKSILTKYYENYICVADLEEELRQAKRLLERKKALSKRQKAKHAKHNLQ